MIFLLLATGGLDFFRKEKWKAAGGEEEIKSGRKREEKPEKEKWKKR